MDRLPQVLQNEIWEYVHGDKTFWKKMFKFVLIELSSMDSKSHFEVAKSLRTMNTEIEKEVGDFCLRMFPGNQTWNVHVTVWSRGYTEEISDCDFNCPIQTQTHFHEQVVNAAQWAEWWRLNLSKESTNILVK